ncbi:hypothetical protein RKH34_005229 [Salmonella enterica]|nr:hypothetical protein [Salmonella enterica]
MSQQENQRKNIVDVFSPSEMQKALMNSVITGNNSELYVEQSHLRVKGNFQITIFEKAWKILIERHDSLRSAFCILMGEIKRYPSGGVKRDPL